MIVSKMITKSTLIFLFLLVGILSFVSSTNYPSPTISLHVGESISLTSSEKRAFCEFQLGCYIKYEGCYPYGYIKNELYCSGEGRSLSEMEDTEHINGFRDQKTSGEFCSTDFQCKSNFCFNEKCVGKIDSLMIHIISRIKVIENKFNIFEEEKEKLINAEEIPNNESQNFQSLKTDSSNEEGLINFFKHLI